MPRYKVAHGTQVALGGRLYGSGESFDAEEADVQREVQSGYLVEAKSKRKTVKRGPKQVETTSRQARERR